MKKISLLIAALLGLAASQPVHGQDVATFVFRTGREKVDRQIVISLDASAAPATVANFENLIRHKFYRHLKVHRVVPHTLVQMGDPLTRYSDRSRVGTGGPGYTLPPELHLKHVVGAVAMSRLPDTLNPGRRSSGSQFYICLKAMPNLDGQYTVFGHVTEGMDVLDALSTAEADTNNNPTTPIVIRDAYLGAAAPRRFEIKIWPWR